MADSKMADTSNNAEVTNNTTAASGIASDDHTYANIPPPAPATANNVPSTTTVNASNATNSDEAAPSSSSDNADRGASASEEPKPKVTNNVDLLFLTSFTIDEFFRIRLITTLLRPLLPDALDENDILHRVITLLLKDRALPPSPPSTSSSN